MGNRNKDSFKAAWRADHPHLNDYLGIIKRRKWLIAIFFIVVVGVVTVKSVRTTPTYKATTQIIIEKDISVLPDIEDRKPESMSEADYSNLHNLLSSRSLARRVADRLDLDKYVESLDEKGAPGAAASMMAAARGFAARFIPEKAGGEQTAGPSQWGKAGADLKRSDPVVEWYLKRLEITPVLGSRMVKISFSTASPELSTLVADAHAKAFIQKSVETRQSSAEESLNWLKAKLAEQKRAVQSSQLEIYKYKKNHNIVSIEDHQSIVSIKLSELNSSLTEAKEDRAQKQAAYERLKSFSLNSADREKMFSIPAIAQDASIRALMGNLSSLKAQMLDENYGPRHPARVQLKEEIARTENELTLEVERLRKNMQTGLELAEEHERSVHESLEDQKRLALELNEKSIDYDVLMQQAQSDQHVYDILLNQFKEMDLARALESSNIRIVDPAEVPAAPVSPRILVNILVSAMGSLFLGFGIVFFMEYADTSVRSPDDVSKGLGIRLLDAVPRNKALRSKDSSPMPYFKAHSPQDEYAPGQAGYSIMRRSVTNMNGLHHGVSGSVFVMSSAIAGEGKTTLLAKLGIDLARGGLKVLIIDADIKNPSLHKALGFERNSTGVITAMAEILSRETGSGELSSFSVSDLCFLISLKKQSGRLTLENDSQKMTVFFRNGRACHIHEPGNPEENRLGAMLLGAGLINEAQLRDALEKSRRTKEPLGYVLVSGGLVTRDQLSRPLSLQMESKLRRALSWNNGCFSFEHCNPQVFEDAASYFDEDYSAVIDRLSGRYASRYLEKSVLSNIEMIKEPNLSFLPVGIAPAVPYHKVYFTLLEKFISIVRRSYDVVLIDAPPLQHQGGGEALCALADGVIMVIKAGGVPAKVVSEVITDLKKARVNIVGAILNQAKTGNQYPYGY